MNAYSGQYRRAKVLAFARSDGICQLCGFSDAVDAHHWAEIYPPGDEVTSNDLTALCKSCHEIGTIIRKFQRAGGSPFEILSILETGLKQRNKKCLRR